MKTANGKQARQRSTLSYRCRSTLVDRTVTKRLLKARLHTAWTGFEMGIQPYTRLISDSLVLYSPTISRIWNGILVMEWLKQWKRKPWSQRPIPKYAILETARAASP